MIERVLKILVVVLSLTNAGIVFAEMQLEGYLGAHFGMSAKEVQATFVNDKVVNSSSETVDSDHLIYAERNQGWITTELLYVFPARSDRLALIIEIFPGLSDTAPVRREQVEKLGEPSSDNYPESVLKRMQASSLIPTGVKQLAVWNITVGGINREARLMALEEYVRLEYIDNKLMVNN